MKAWQSSTKATKLEILKGIIDESLELINREIQQLEGLQCQRQAACYLSCGETEFNGSDWAVAVFERADNALYQA